MSTASPNVLTDRSLLIKWAITLLIPLLVCLIPLTETYTLTMRLYFVATLFVIFLFAFETLPTLISALLLPALYVVLGVVPFAVAYAPWTQSTVSMVLGGFLTANICSDCGVLERMAYWIVRKCGGSFMKVTIGLFLACLAICWLTFGNGVVIGIVFCYALCKALHYEKTKEGAIIMTASILGGAMCNHMVYNPLAMGIALPVAQQAAPGLTITVLDLFKAFWPLALFAIFILWFYAKMYKIPTKEKMAGGVEYFEEASAKLGKMTLQEKKALIMLAVIMAYMLLQPVHGLGMEYAFMIVPLVAFFPGINLGTMETIKKVPFEMLFFVAACAAIGSVGMAIGLGTVVASALVPIVSSTGSNIFLIGVFIMGALANLLMTPIAMMAAFPAPLILATAHTGLNPQSIVFTMFLAGDMLFLPYESANYLIMYSFGAMTMKDFIVTSTVRSIFMLLFFAVILLPYWTLIGVL